MKKLKAMLSLIMAVSLISTAPVCVKAASVKISDRSIDTRYQDVELRGVKPVLTGMPNIAFQNQLNERIDAQYNNFIKKTGANTKKAVFSYKTIDSGHYFSLLFYCSVNDAVSSQNYVSTTVINVPKETLLTLNDVLGANGVKLINKNFSAEIAANPNKYNTAFTGIDNDHNFYLDGGTVHMLFDEFEIFTGSVGIVDVTLQINDIKNLVLEKGDYRTKDDYGIKMVPLRQIAEEFGYAVMWNPTTNTADIVLDRSIITSVKIGSNSYMTSPSSARRELESAPLIYDSRTYVPISFFEEILSISYSISANGQITFSVYK